MKRTARNIDKPISVLGMLPEDLGIAGGVFWLGIFFDHPGYGLVAALLVSFIWGQYRKDKPEGYLQHLLYNAGISLAGLLPPPKRRSYYSF